MKKFLTITILSALAISAFAKGHSQADIAVPGMDTGTETVAAAQTLVSKKGNRPADKDPTDSPAVQNAGRQSPDRPNSNVPAVLPPEHSASPNKVAFPEVNMQSVVNRLVPGFALLDAGSAFGHEFWIEAEDAKTANIRVGQMLVGEDLPFLDRIVRSARHFGPAGEKDISVRQGDMPALKVDVSEPGLHQITVETQPAYAVFETLPEFSDYLAFEYLQAVLEEHGACGLAEQEIAEEYLRYARSLVQVGPANGEADAAIGLRYELIAPGLPFESNVDQLDVQILWEGLADPDVQIAVFHRSAPTNVVTRELLRSDADGKVRVDIRDPGFYVFNAVHMIPADGPGSVVWQSDWASLSFTREVGAAENESVVRRCCACLEPPCASFVSDCRRSTRWAGRGA